MMPWTRSFALSSASPFCLFVSALCARYDALSRFWSRFCWIRNRRRFALHQREGLVSIDLSIYLPIYLRLSLCLYLYVYLYAYLYIYL